MLVGVWLLLLALRMWLLRGWLVLLGVLLLLGLRRVRYLRTVGAAM
jgi:hypothetical protein